MGIVICFYQRVVFREMKKMDGQYRLYSALERVNE
jgi:hypothetical protein